MLSYVKPRRYAYLIKRLLNCKYLIGVQHIEWHGHAFDVESWSATY